MYQVNPVLLPVRIIVKAVALDEDMKEYEIEGEGLMARAICHELEHLDGHLYVEKVEGELHSTEYEEA